MPETTDEERTVRPFADFLNDHNRGAEHRQASEALQELVLAVTDTGKAGSLTVTTKVEPMKNTDGAMMTTVTVVSKLPKQPVRSAVFYADAEGNLRREDPRQPAFEGLKDVGGGAAEVKDVPAASVKDGAL